MKSFGNCRYFKAKTIEGNVSMIGICTHPNSGIAITENVGKSLCCVCHLHKEIRG